MVLVADEPYPASHSSADTLLAGTRLLVFCDYYGPASNGGSERVAREVNTRLAAAGAEITVLSALDGDPYADRGVRVAPVEFFDLSRMIGAQLAIAPRYVAAARAAMHAVQPHVIVAHSLHFHGSIVAARLRGRTSAPLVTIAHVAGVDQIRGRTRWLAELHERTIARRILARSDVVVAVSDAVRAHCVYRGASASTVRVVRNGVDLDRFVATAEPKCDPPTVLYVGRLIADKGPQVLLAAVHVAKRAGHRLRVVFVGDGPMRATLEADARSAGVDAVFVGNSDDVPRWMQRANVLVLPSFKEGFGLVIAEAFASRRCALASDLPSTRELVTDGTSGLLHQPGDAAQLADQLLDICNDPTRRWRLAQRGYESVADLTWDRSAAQYGQIIAELRRPSGQQRAQLNR